MSTVVLKFTPEVQYLCEANVEAMLFEHGKEDTSTFAHQEMMKGLEESAQEFFITQLLETDRWDDLVVKLEQGIFDRIGNSFILHEACKKDPPLKVVKAIVERFPESARTPYGSDSLLPLHVACMFGVSKEVFMLILLQDPEAANTGDAAGKVPLDYARFLTSDTTRHVSTVALQMAPYVTQIMEESKKHNNREIQNGIELVKKEYEKELEAHLKIHADEKANLTRGAEEREATLLQLEEKLSTAENQISSLEERTEQQKRDHILALSKHTAILKSAEQMCTELNEEMNSVRNQAEEKETSILALKGALEQRDEDFNQAVEEIERLEKKVSRMDKLMASIRHLATTAAVEESNEVGRSCATPPMETEISKIESRDEPPRSRSESEGSDAVEEWRGEGDMHATEHDESVDGKKVSFVLPKSSSVECDPMMVSRTGSKDDIDPIDPVDE